MRPLYPWDGHPARQNPVGKHRRTVKRKEKAVRTSSDFVAQLGGMAVMLGGALLGVLVPLVTLTYPGRAGWASVETVFSLAWEDYSRMLTAALVLTLVGLACLGTRSWARSGSSERAGFIVSLVGLGLVSAGNVLEFWVAGGIRGGVTAVAMSGWTAFSLGFLLLAVGLVILGITAIRAKSLTYGNAVPLILGVLALPVFVTFTNGISFGVALGALFGLGWVVLGYVLWSETGEAAATGKTGEASRGTP